MQTYRDPAEPLLMSAGPSIGIEMAPPVLQLAAYGTLQTLSDPTSEAFKVGHRDLQSSVSLLDPITGLPGDEWYWHWTVESAYPEQGPGVSPSESYDGWFTFYGSFPEGVGRITYTFTAELYTLDEYEEVVTITTTEFFMDLIDISGWTYEITNRNMCYGEDGIITGSGDLTIPDAAIEWGPLPLSFAFGPNVAIRLVDPNGAELYPLSGEEIQALYTHYDFSIVPIQVDSGWSESVRLFLAGRDARAYYSSYDQVGFTYAGIEFGESPPQGLMMLIQQDTASLALPAYVLVHNGQRTDNIKLRQACLTLEYFHYDSAGSRLPIVGDLTVDCSTGVGQIALWDNPDPPNPQSGGCSVTKTYTIEDQAFIGFLDFWVQGKQIGRKGITGGFEDTRDFAEVIVYQNPSALDLDIGSCSGFGSPLRTTSEEDAEDQPPGGIVRVNDGDIDGDRVTDSSDRQIDGASFVTLIFQIFPDQTPIGEITINVEYDSKLCIWKKDASEQRTTDDILSAGGHSAEDLGIDIDEPCKYYYIATLYVEALSPSAASGDLTITFSAQFDGENHSDSVKATALRINLKEITFSGDNLHPVIQDNGNAYPNPPQWQDSSDPLNGQAKDTGDRRIPICYTSGSTMLASAKIVMEPVIGDQIKIKGVPLSYDVQLNQGPEIPEAAAVVDGNTLTTPATQASAAFATNFRGAMELDWQLSTKTGDEEWTEWISTGLKSDNRVYILRQEPAPQADLYETVLDIACARIPVHQDNDSVVEAIWGKFKTLDVRRKEMDGLNVKDGVKMTYWKWDQGFIAASVPQMLAKREEHDGNADCGAWANLLRHVLKVHDISSVIYELAVPEGAQCLLVHNWTFGRHITTGADGVRQSSRAGDDRILARSNWELGPGTVNWPCIGPGEDGILQSTVEPDENPETADQYGDGVRSTLKLLEPILYSDGDVYPYLEYLRDAHHIGGDAIEKKGIGAQGNPNPKKKFLNHAIVKYAENVYDPSYGIGPQENGTLDELAYEREAIAGTYKETFDGMAIRMKNPENRDLIWNPQP